MLCSRFLLGLALLVLPGALVGTTWLYLYPVFHACGFPTPPPPPRAPAPPRAPFRLLSLGDPQLEGDSSLPDPAARAFPSVALFARHVRDAATWAQRGRVAAQAAQGAVADAGRWLEGRRKAVDLWGNDLYLAHIVRSLRWATEPTHLAVLGDLLGSQWVTNGEFRKRAGRYWGVVMSGLDRVPDRVFARQPADAQRHGEDSNKQRTAAWGGTTEVLGADTAWNRRVINIAGNHDVGYAGDLDESRIERFERAFGSVNWDIWFELPWQLRSSPNSTHASDPPPALRLVILNTMNLDTPALSPALQTETYAFTNHIITNSRPVHDKTHATILLTHIPLEKEPGICVDSPYFHFFDSGQGVKEQNMLSGHASRIVLEGIFGMSGNKEVDGKGMGRRGVVVNGHDHAGCHVVHYIRQPGVESTCSPDGIKKEDAYWPPPTAEENMAMPSLDADMSSSPNDTDMPVPLPPPSPPPSDPEFSKWRARRFPPLPYDISPSNHCLAIDEAPHIREITLRSMMGEFSGYAGFLSAWFDEQKGDKGEWVFEFATCGLGIQHWWWGIHVLDLALVVCLVGWRLAGLAERSGVGRVEGQKDGAKGMASEPVVHSPKLTKGLSDAVGTNVVGLGGVDGKA